MKQAREVFPARAGVIPVKGFVKYAKSSIPRASGGDPYEPDITSESL